MDIRYLEYILTIAEEKNLSKAAEKVFISQPALSQYLHKLEKELNTKLFVREQNSLSLTDSGKVYLNGIKSILSIKKEGEFKLAQLKNPSSTKIKIGINNYLQNFFYTYILPLYKDSNPKISFDVQIISSQDSLYYLENNAVDVVLIVNHLGLTELASAKFLNLFYDETVLISNSKNNYLNYLNSPQEIISKIDLPLVLFKNNTKFRSMQEAIMSKYNINTEILCEVESFDTILRIVSSNSAISFVPQSLFERNHNYSIFNIFPETRMPVCVCYKQANTESEALKNFLPLLKNIAVN